MEIPSGMASSGNRWGGHLDGQQWGDLHACLTGVSMEGWPVLKPLSLFPIGIAAVVNRNTINNRARTYGNFFCMFVSSGVNKGYGPDHSMGNCVVFEY
jgi:hypothetical protein